MTDSNQSIVSQSSGDSESMVATIVEILRQHDFRVDNLLPAIFQNFDRTINQATVMPLIQVVTTDDKNLSRKMVAQVPVLSLGGGGFHVSFPIKKGDLCWIWANDRDISLFKQALIESPPNSKRSHRFEDGMVIPDVFRKYTMNSEDSTAMVIQSTDGTTRIAIDTGGNIRITAPTKVLVRTPLAEFTQNVQIDGNLAVHGTSELTGNVHSPATITGDTDVVFGGISGVGHKHGGVQSGASNTTGPHN